MDELWKDIPGYEGHYQISNLGRVKSIKFKNHRIMKTKVDMGYEQIGLRLPNKIKKFFKIHRLVAKAFISNPNNYPQVNHKDGNKLNNHVENLEWCSSSQNVKHSFDILGKQIPKGENSTSSKLKESDVLAIRQLLKEGNLSQQKIADKYGISQAQVWRIKNKLRWSHI
jgi:predicted XRE-type DNA-binding protein